ncbi:MAG TPA: helix-turn-helix domain-containing protein [Gemmatimonadales bacterium]|nr:helix-turn-helix domain-containing protein [Gemmatimonadales bacterium]
MTSLRLAEQQLASPLGYRGIRGAVLVHLKRAEVLTTRELADRVGASLNAVRHHLKELEEQGLVEYERQHRGVGAPVFAYRLTPAGDAVFPKRYEATLTNLLDQLVEREGRASTIARLESRYEAMAAELREQLAAASLDERLAAVTRMLTSEGYMAEASVSDGKAILTEHNCAIRLIAERFPEICAAEARFLSAVLGGEVQRERHILSGCSACEYRVNLEEQNAPPGGESV